MPFGFFDPTFVLLIPAVILTFYAQAKVRSTFDKYSRVAAQSRMTGAQVARAILRQAGVDNVTVERIGDTLGDHYDPKNKVLRLSPEVHDSYSIAALGVAAHEAGHAIQHDVGYSPLVMRNGLVPLANIGSMGGPWLFMIGLFFGNLRFLMDIGIVFFFAAVLFYFVTLPVEYNASNRAIEVLESGGYLTRDEIVPARAVLGAAALTYVSAATMAVSQLIRLLMIRGMSRNDD
jgi:Zn-dependent membrane protease YugP